MRVRFTVLPDINAEEEPVAVVRSSFEECQGIEKHLWIMFRYASGPWTCGRTIAEEIS
jgi:hypothetical protein